MTNIWPLHYRVGKRLGLRELSDEQLIRIMFYKFNMFPVYIKYRYALEAHFRQNTGEDLYHHMEEWKDDKNSGKLNLINFLKKKIKNEYKLGKLRVGHAMDISQDLAKEENIINFRKTWRMLNEMAAFGGIQQIEVLGFLQKEKMGKGYSWDQFGKIRYEETLLEIELRFMIKDWFGVDEQDIYNNDVAAQLDREGLAAMWILQHQRGYRPFINVITYKEIIEVVI